VKLLEIDALDDRSDDRVRDALIPTWGVEKDLL
jgi:hypothetical protein